MPSTFILRDPRGLARAALAGPGAALTTPAAVTGLSAALPPGPAGIEGITPPLVLLPLVWAAPFVQACLDRSLRRVAAVDLSASAADRLRVSLRGPAGPGQRGIDLELAPDGRVLHRRAGSAAEVEGGDPEGALSAFLIGVHVRLYVPVPWWGYAVTGAAGLALLVAALSGLVIHRHLLRETFTLRRAARPALAARDRHNLAGAWALPFALVLAVTGCFFSFAASVGFPALAWVSYGGDQQKLFAAISGAPQPVDAAPAPGADLDATVADAVARADAAPDVIRLANPGGADARVTVYAEARESDLTPDTLVYDGASDAFLERRPAIGRVPSFGGTLYGLMAPLHVGDFAGLASKLVWTALGFCCCTAILSGLRLWVARRGAGWAALDRMTSVAGFGLPLASAGAAATGSRSARAGRPAPSTSAAIAQARQGEARAA